jgi:hypothetical protein
VTGYYLTRQKFDASETGISFGRYEKAALTNGYDFVRMQTPTPQQPNSSPLVAPLVITEIMYNPVQEPTMNIWNCIIAQDRRFL